MKTVFITGVNGFVGQHLVREIHKAGSRVIGVGQQDAIAPTIASLVDAYYACDLADASAVAKLPLGTADAIVHLAGLAAAAPSFEHPGKYISQNTAMLINLAEISLKKGRNARYLAVSSGAIYAPEQKMPLTENSKVKFSSPYVVSKIAVENLCAYYHLRGLDMLVVRPFNHVGPGQNEGFLIPDLYRKLQTCLKTGAPLVVGDLTTLRDYTDVRDVARAYTQLVNTSGQDLTSSVYNVCSGVSRSGKTILSMLKKHFPGGQKIKITVDPSLIRANDPKKMVGSSRLLTHDTGWQPTIPLEQTIADFVSWEESS